MQVLLDQIRKRLSPKQKHYLKSKSAKHSKGKWPRYVDNKYLKIKMGAVNLLYSYTSEQLENKLGIMGITEGDTILMHNSFNFFNGFKEEVKEVLECLLNIIGPSGNLLMMSMSYTGSAYEYFKKEKLFDVKRSISRMGILTEIFRRRKGVLRSLNPVHPILASGPKAKWITSDHEKTIYSCGRESPFQKIVELNGKVLFFDVDYLTCTFLHYLEDRFRDDIPLKVYHDELIESTVISQDGEEMIFKTQVFDPETAESRDRIWLELKDELIKKKHLKTDKIGNSKLMLVTTKQLVDGAQEMLKKVITSKRNT